MAPGAHPPDRLEQMFRRQLHLQRVGRSLDPPGMRGEARGWYATWNHTALIKELGEALDEVAWKPWSVDKDTFNPRQFLMELVDAMHFLMNMALLSATYGIGEPDDVTAKAIADDFYKLYVDKSAVNMERFRSGTYDAKATKCPDCGRAIEDGERATSRDHQRVEDNRIIYSLAYDCICGRVNFMESFTRDSTPR